MTEPESQSTRKIDWLLIGGLLLLVLPLRLWLLHNTEVAARDSINYVQYALQFEKQDWRTVLAENHQHPGYPLMVWLMSLPVRAIDGTTTPENLALSTQLVSTTAALLLILPMYWLGRQFFDRKISFWATLLFQYLPIGAQHLSDGISEPAYLLLIVSGLLQAIHAVRERSLWRCGLCGFFAGLAYLTRPEGVVILAAAAAVAIVMQFRAESRCSWKRFFACAGTMAVVLMLTGAPYPLATGRLSNKPSLFQVFGLKNPFEQQVRLEEPSAPLSSPRVLFAATFPRVDSKLVRLVQSVKALLIEITQGLHFLGAIPAILGLWWSFGRLRLNAGFWVVAVFCALHSMLLMAHAISACYISDRHVMILVLFACYFVVVGLRELPSRILAWRKMEIAEFSWTWRSAPAWSALLLLGLIACCLPKATQRLHANRAGNYAAGHWLFDHVQEGDIIDDVYDWSRYFSGQFLKAGHDPDHVPTCYIVEPVNGPKLESLLRPRVAKRPDATVEYFWPESGDVVNARIVIYAQPAAR
jgi:hypothetical protein